jgi:hypothetical protein
VNGLRRLQADIRGYFGRRNQTVIFGADRALRDLDFSREKPANSCSTPFILAQGVGSKNGSRNEPGLPFGNALTLF